MHNIVDGQSTRRPIITTVANTFGSGTLAIANVAPGFGYLMKISSAGTPLWLHKVNNAGGGGDGQGQRRHHCH
jgi:hypothetical protein